MNADLSTRTRRVGVVVWCSFLTASGATMVLFALFDPDQLLSMAPWWWGRRAAYALGFFFLWAITACSAALATYMAHTERAGER